MDCIIEKMDWIIKIGFFAHPYFLSHLMVVSSTVSIQKFGDCVCLFQRLLFYLLFRWVCRWEYQFRRLLFVFAPLQGRPYTRFCLWQPPPPHLLFVFVVPSSLFCLGASQRMSIPLWLRCILGVRWVIGRHCGVTTLEVETIKGGGKFSF